MQRDLRGRLSADDMCTSSRMPEITLYSSAPQSCGAADGARRLVFPLLADWSGMWRPSPAQFSPAQSSLKGPGWSAALFRLFLLSGAAQVGVLKAIGPPSEACMDYHCFHLFLSSVAALVFI